MKYFFLFIILSIGFDFPVSVLPEFYENQGPKIIKYGPAAANADILTIPAGNAVTITCNGIIVQKTSTDYDCVALLPISNVDATVVPTLNTRVTRRKGNTTKRVDVTVDRDTTIKINGVSR
jgi:hypothetical protein